MANQTASVCAFTNDAGARIRARPAPPGRPVIEVGTAPSVAHEPLPEGSIRAASGVFLARSAHWMPTLIADERLRPITDPLVEERERRHRMATWFAGLLTIVVGLATAIRPLLDDASLVFAVLGVAHTGLLAGLWYLFRSGRVRRWAPAILMSAVCVLLLPLLMISGGASSRFAVLVPLYPICAMLLGGRRMAVAVFVWWLVALPVIVLLEPYVQHWSTALTPDLLEHTHALWLILAAGVGLAFARRFDAEVAAMRGRLVESAEFDPLTGIANRRGYARALPRLLAATSRRGGRVTFVVADIDHFKRYNDSNGHDAGDGALVAVAATLGGVLRRGQDLIARFGGEEFLIVLSEIDAEASAAVVEKLRAAVEGLGLPFDGEQGAVLTATFGWVNVAAADVVDPDDLYRRADAALYEGKRSGRNRVVRAEDVPGSCAAAELP